MAKKMICSQCGGQKTKIKTPGTLLLEIFLWLLLLLPGFIYSIWRISGRKKVCADCESENIIPIQSPKGKQLFAEFKEPINPLSP